MWHAVPLWAFIVALLGGVALGAAIFEALRRRHKSRTVPPVADNSLEVELMNALSDPLRRYLTDSNSRTGDRLVVRISRVFGVDPKERNMEALVLSLVNLDDRIKELARTQVSEDRVVRLALQVVATTIAAIAGLTTVAAFVLTRL